MSIARRPIFACALVAALLATISALATPAKASSVTVTHAVLQSGLFDAQGNFFPATCREVQVVTSNQRKETFHCDLTGGIPARTGPSQPGDIWFSDFDGAQSTSSLFVVTPSGHIEGWAVY